MASLISESLEKHGATIHHGSSLKRMEIKNGKVEYELEYKDGTTEIINVDKALVSAPLHLQCCGTNKDIVI